MNRLPCFPDQSSHMFKNSQLSQSGAWTQRCKVPMDWHPLVIAKCRCGMPSIALEWDKWHASWANLRRATAPRLLRLETVISDEVDKHLVHWRWSHCNAKKWTEMIEARLNGSMFQRPEVRLSYQLHCSCPLGYPPRRNQSLRLVSRQRRAKDIRGMRLN